MAVLGLVGESEGATLGVPEDYATILEAVDAAVAGDTVLVGPGTWTAVETRVLDVNGQLLPFTSAAFLHPGVSVVSRDGPHETVVSTGLGTTVFVSSVPGVEQIEVDGFTLTGGTALVVASDAQTHIRSCKLVNNHIFAADLVSSAVDFIDCEISNNTLGGSTRAAVFASSATLSFVRCIFDGNLGDHAVEMASGPAFVMNDCKVVNNLGKFSPIRIVNTSQVSIRNTLFADNWSQGTGGGAQIVDSFGAVDGCVFLRNTVGNGGGGLRITRGDVRMSNNTFYQCHAGGLGSAISITGEDPGVHNNLMVECTGLYGVVDRTRGANHPDTGCNLFWNNEPPNYSPFGTWTASATDLYVDPLFCGPEVDDFTIHSGSPATGVSGSCTQIGALDVGCGVVSVRRSSWGKVKAGYR